MRACNPSSNAFADVIVVEARYARLRKLQAFALLAAAVCAGWIWLGNTGAGMLGLWAWSFAQSAWVGGVHRLCVPLGQLRYARLSEHRVLCVGRRFASWELFADEVPVREFARVRRELKAWFANPVS